MGETTVAKSAKGHGYNYADLASINKYLEDLGVKYYQYTDLIEGNDYIYTVPIIEGKELPARRGCRVAQANLQGSGKGNPAQEQGSALTYARRYSVLMAFGLAAEDDDGAALNKNHEPEKKPAQPKPQKQEPKPEQNPEPKAEPKPASIAQKNAIAKICANRGINKDELYKNWKTDEDRLSIDRATAILTALNKG